MPRSKRVDVGGEIYHVINRANGRLKIFNDANDYMMMIDALIETLTKIKIGFVA